MLSPTVGALDLLQLDEALALILILVALHKVQAALILQIHDGLHQRWMLVAQLQPQLATRSQMPTGQLEDQTSHTQSIRAAI